MEIIESEVGLGELVGLEDLLYKSNDLQIININPLVIKNYSSYLDYYSPAPKVIITIISRGKLADIRATLNTRIEVSYISLNVVLRFKIPITHSTKIALRTIIRTKSRFIRFIDNITVIIGNTIVKTRFYIIESPRIKVVLRFPFI